MSSVVLYHQGRTIEGKEPRFLIPSVIQEFVNKTDWGFLKPLRTEIHQFNYKLNILGQYLYFILKWLHSRILFHFENADDFNYFDDHTRQVEALENIGVARWLSKNDDDGFENGIDTLEWANVAHRKQTSSCCVGVAHDHGLVWLVRVRSGTWCFVCCWEVGGLCNRSDCVTEDGMSQWKDVLA